MIPALNDAELERIFDAAATAGARTAGYVLLRLPLEIKELFEEWLEAHYPDRKARVLKLVRETRGGKLYESGWGLRMRGRGVYAELLEKRFRSACRKSGLDRSEWALDETRFRHPATKADPAQMTLF
jgi:DNA repair photolyase